jgi:anti-anti-sigma factor
MPTERQFTIPGLLEKVPEVSNFVATEAEAAGLDERAVYHCEVAVDEWCTNIIEHGCEDCPGDEHHIQITCKEQSGQFVVSIIDDGMRFDPTTLADVDPNKPLEEREPGGLGWFFIRKFMDQVYYEYKDGLNHLTMIKWGARRKVKMEQPAEAGFPVKELKDGIWVVTPSGRLDSTTARSLEVALTAQLDASHTRLVLDMTRVSYISSSGLKVIMSAWRRAQKLGGSIVLVGLSPRVQEVFEISGFSTIFTTVASLEEAMATISDGKDGR